MMSLPVLPSLSQPSAAPAQADSDAPAVSFESALESALGGSDPEPAVAVDQTSCPECLSELVSVEGEHVVPEITLDLPVEPEAMPEEPKEGEEPETEPVACIDCGAPLVLPPATAPAATNAGASPAAATVASPAPLPGTATVAPVAQPTTGAAPPVDGPAPEPAPMPAPVSTPAAPSATAAAPPSATAAAPPSATAAAPPAGETVAASVRFVERVERVVEQLQAAGPPKSMVVDLGDSLGSRITVSLRGGAVHITFSSLVADDVSAWMTDLQRALVGRGLELSGDGPTGWGGRGQQDQAGRRREESTPDGAHWKWPPSQDDSGGSHGSDRSD